jgi:hypothetical protein
MRAASVTAPGWPSAGAPASTSCWRSPASSERSAVREVSWSVCSASNRSTSRSCSFSRSIWRCCSAREVARSDAVCVRPRGRVWAIATSSPTANRVAQTGHSVSSTDKRAASVATAAAIAAWLSSMRRSSVSIRVESATTASLWRSRSKRCCLKAATLSSEAMLATRLISAWTAVSRSRRSWRVLA